MADDDPTAGVDPTDVGAVADVLYRLPPDRFVAARTAFVTAARGAGERDTAREIQGLGRPTRAAWVLNRLARDAPDVVEALVALGAELAAAQADLDATTLRGLGDRRRTLVRDVARQAFGIVGETSPPPALAVEVQNTLTAAVVDPEVGAAVRGGALLKAAQASGFGPAGPELASVPPPRRLRAVAAPPAPAPQRGRAAAKPGRADADTRGAAAARAAEQKREAAEQKREAAQQREAARQRERIAAADGALAAARTRLEAARAAETEAQEQLRIRREQVRDADRALGDAGLAVREARAAVREAEKARRAAR